MKKVWKEGASVRPESRPRAPIFTDRGVEAKGRSLSKYCGNPPGWCARGARWPNVKCCCQLGGAGDGCLFKGLYRRRFRTIEFLWRYIRRWRTPSESLLYMMSARFGDSLSDLSTFYAQISISCPSAKLYLFNHLTLRSVRTSYMGGCRAFSYACRCWERWEDGTDNRRDGNAVGLLHRETTPTHQIWRQEYIVKAEGSDMLQTPL